MKRLSFLALPLIFLLGCSNDKVSTGPSGPSVISVAISPSRAFIDLADTTHFRATVNGTSNQTVLWSTEGDSTCGRINSSGDYIAPAMLPNVDSVRIIARAGADSAKFGTAWAILVDPSKIYVSSTGSDANGTGSKWRPYRSITKALNLARMSQIVIVGAGQYDITSGEQFPLRVNSGVTIQGAGGDSTIVTSPGGMDPMRDTTFVVYGSAINIEKLSVQSSNSMGIGFWVRQGSWITLSRIHITQNYIGIYVSGSMTILESNVITNDMIGIMTTGISRPFMRGNTITQCQRYGIAISDSSQPNLGTNDSTAAGNNTVQDCGNGCQWLIYNTSPDTIFAIGNTWPYLDDISNDVCIYDDEESSSASGPVILVQP